MNKTIEKIGQRDHVTLKKGFSLDQVSGHDPTLGHLWIIIDDHMAQPIYHDLSILFANTSRAKNISVTVLTQNLYSKAGDSGRYNRDILVNRNVLVLFNSRQDEQMVQSVAKKCNIPYNVLLSAYHLACNGKTAAEYGVADDDESNFDDEDEATKKKKYSHLMIILTPNTLKEVELRSNSFFMEEHTILYWPKAKDG